LDVENKRDDDWAKEVLRWINSVICLVSEEAKYDKAYGRKLCNQFPSIENRKRGRPHDERLANAIFNLCDFIKNENECQFSTNMFSDKMERLCEEKT